MPKPIAIIAALVLAVPAAAFAGPQEAEHHQTPEMSREQEADQKAATAGEAPASEHRRGGAQDDAGARPAMDAAAAKDPRRNALEHLGRIETIVLRLLGSEEAPGDEPVGTTGTPVAEDTGERVTISRARLEEIRMHLEQARVALEEHGGDRTR